jgi:transcriptional regulator with XRE-family HTH domain
LKGHPILGHPTLGPKLRRLRTRAGLTQEQLAHAAGCSDRLIRRAESSLPLRYETLERIAAALSSFGVATIPADLMSDPLTIAKQLWKSYTQNQHRLVDRFSHFDQDLEWFVAGTADVIPFAGHWRGLDQVRKGLECFSSHLQRKPAAGQPLYLEGDRHVTIKSSERWNRIGNGAEIADIWITFHLEFRKGRIQRVEHHFDTLAAARLLANQIPKAQR